MEKQNHTSKDILFSPLELRNITLPNRFVRSATYEGLGDSEGVPQVELADLYSDLARGGTGTLITGFTFISQAGRAMQTGQCGIDTKEKSRAWKTITSRVFASVPEVKLVMQLAHTGRQTLTQVTGMPVVGVSRRKCTYFRQKPEVLNDSEIKTIVREFGEAALRAKDCGFHGVQVHGAHGYLVHQFLSPWTNTRKDKWSDSALFLEHVIRGIRERCGDRFPVFVKLSYADDNPQGLRVEDTIRTVKRLEELEVDAVEISYGSMEYALNIFRGGCPIDEVLKVNPLFNHIPALFRMLWKKFCLKRFLKVFIPFSENYNVPAAFTIKKETRLPIISVGGIRSLQGMIDCLAVHGLDAVSLCRPLILESDLPGKIRRGESIRAQCVNCNLCAIYCDSSEPVKCYQKGRKRRESCESI